MAQVPNKIQSGGNAAERARESRGSRLTPPPEENNARAKSIRNRVDYKQSGKGDFVVPEENNAYVRAKQKSMEDKQKRMMGG
jgi:hypothetical protein